MTDALTISAFAALDREGKLDEIKGLLPQGAAGKERFVGGIALDLAAIIAFCTALGAITGAVTGVGDVVELANKLARWVKALGSGRKETAPLGLRERALVLLFDAQANRKTGMSEEKLRTILGCGQAELASALDELVRLGIARKALSGDWKYAAGPA